MGIESQPALIEKGGFVQIETGEVRLTRLPGFPRAGFALGRKAQTKAESAAVPPS